MHRTGETTNLMATIMVGAQPVGEPSYPPILPDRFNSTSAPSGVSIVRPELNSISQPALANLDSRVYDPAGLVTDF